jgi:hypothetical protein
MIIKFIQTFLNMHENLISFLRFINTNYVFLIFLIRLIPNFDKFPNSKLLIHSFSLTILQINFL